MYDDFFVLSYNETISLSFAFTYRLEPTNVKPPLFDFSNMSRAEQEKLQKAVLLAKQKQAKERQRKEEEIQKKRDKEMAAQQAFVDKIEDMPDRIINPTSKKNGSFLVWSSDGYDNDGKLRK